MPIRARSRTTTDSNSTSATPPPARLQRACNDPACASEEMLGIQPKLTVGAPDDAYEQEADRIAEQVVSGGGAPDAPAAITPLVQRKAGASTLSTAGASHAAINTAATVVASGGSPLGEAERDFFEPRFGRDLSHIRLHTNSAANHAASGINALAYTLRNHIIFGRGQYSPSTTDGRRLLAHELVHTLQQGAAPPSSRGRGESADSAGTVGSSPHTSSPHISPPRISRLPDPERLQRQCPPPVRNRGGAAGCGLCMGGNFGVTGALVHQLVQYAFFAEYPDMVPSGGGMELIVPTVPEGETAPFTPEVDLSLEREENGLRVLYIGELKPFDDAGRQRQQAREKLNDYARELRAGGIYDDVRLLRLDPPPEFPFIEIPYPPGCPRQFIHTCRIESGIYQYYCDPSWADLQRDPRCRCEGRRDRDQERQQQREQQQEQDQREDRPYDPVPLPHGEPRGGNRPQTEQSPDEVERPPVVPVPPVTVPHPEQPGEPEVGPETEPEGPRVIPFPRPPVPEDEPEVLPEAARVALAAAVAAAILAGLKQLARRLPAAALRRVIAPLEAAAVAALVIFYSDRVEASPGSGESPLEAIFDLMQQDGIPVTDEMRARIEADPQLKAALERAASGGSLSEAQRAIGQRTMELIAENPEAFSEEDLRLLAEAMEAVSGGGDGAQPTVETLHRMIEAQRQGRPITSELPQSGEGADGGAGTEMESESETAPITDVPEGESGIEPGEEETPLPQVSEEMLEALAESGEAERLLRAMAGRLGRGPEITDEVVRRFLETVPDDLTPEEVDALIERLAPMEEGLSLDEILQRIRNSIESVREGEAADEQMPSQEETPEAQEPEAQEPEVQEPGAQEPEIQEPEIQEPEAPENGLTENEAIQRIRAFLARSPATGSFMLPPNAVIEAGRTFTILMASNRNGLTAGFVRFTLVRHIEGRNWTITLYPTRLYDAEGNYVETFPSAPTETEVTLPRQGRRRR